MARSTMCLVLLAMIAMATVATAASDRMLLQAVNSGQAGARSQRAQQDTQSVIRNAVKQAPRAVAAPGPSGAQTRTASQAGVPIVQSTASPRSGNVNGH